MLRTDAAPYSPTSFDETSVGAKSLRTSNRPPLHQETAAGSANERYIIHEEVNPLRTRPTWFSPRATLIAAALSLTCFLASPGPEPVLAAPAAVKPVSAETALTRLKEGNQRYVSGRVQRLLRQHDRPLELDGVQYPMAEIVACSDSRVDPVLAFDQGWGNLFVTRLAGNVVDNIVLASTEYAVTALHTKLIVVLGHEKCGAVQAAMSGKKLDGHLSELMDMIRPAVARADKLSGDREHNCIVENIRSGMQAVRNNPTVKAQPGIQVVGAYYNFDTGVVEWIP